MVLYIVKYTSKNKQIRLKFPCKAFLIGKAKHGGMTHGDKPHANALFIWL